MSGFPAEVERPARPLVWLLEDSPLEAAAARRALSTTFEVEVFADGPTLIERMATGPTPAVLVLDVRLPGMSGIDVCQFMRSRFDDAALPILMLTVYGHKSDLVEGLGAGANDYLTKPYDAAELRARVMALARVKSLSDAAQEARQQVASLLERERVARRDAEAANQAKDGFLAMVSHELRTPLSAILGWTRLLRADRLAPDQRDRALETVERNALAQVQLIDDLLDMTRILSGKLVIENEPVELVGVVNASLDAVRPIAAAKAIHITPQIRDDGARIRGDHSRLVQVVTNLMTNAIKFTPAEGSIELTLARQAETVEIVVTDTGRGIDPALLPHVFVAFRQGEEGSKRKYGGLGLGLSIVRHIVDLHGGTVQARSEGLGKGATFVVSLPRSRAGASDPPSRASLVHGTLLAAAGNRLARRRVLVVEDEPDALELLATMLRREGAVVLLASTAAAAYELIQAHLPDVLISDVGMPDEDGYELIGRIRQLPVERGGRTPAIALTAFAHPRDRHSSLDAGFDLYMTKPVDPVELAIAVASLANRNAQ